VNIVRLEIEPEFTSEPVAKAITGLRVQDHFGWTSSAAGKKDEPRILAQGWFGVEIGIGLTQARVEVSPPGGFSIYTDAMFQLQAFSFCGAFGIGDQRSGLGSFEAVLDITGG
jgi:hypothetical protein